MALFKVLLHGLDLLLRPVEDFIEPGNRFGEEFPFGIGEFCREADVFKGLYRIGIYGFPIVFFQEFSCPRFSVNFPFVLIAPISASFPLISVSINSLNSLR